MFHFEAAEFFEVADAIRDAGPPQVTSRRPAGGTGVRLRRAGRGPAGDAADAARAPGG